MWSTNSAKNKIEKSINDMIIDLYTSINLWGYFFIVRNENSAAYSSNWRLAWFKNVSVATLYW